MALRFSTRKSQLQLEKVEQYLTGNPWARNKEIAYACGCSLTTARKYRAEALSGLARKPLAEPRGDERLYKFIRAASKRRLARLIIYLAQSPNASYKQISEDVGLPMGSVGRYHAEAVKRLTYAPVQD